MAMRLCFLWMPSFLYRLLTCVRTVSRDTHSMSAVCGSVYPRARCSATIPHGMVNGQYSGRAAWLKAAAEIKKNVGVPVGASGYMDPRTAPDLIVNAVKDGQVDFLLLNRPLTVDPDMPNKLLAGPAGQTKLLTCDTVVECYDMVPNTHLADALAGFEVYPVGDCAKPFNIAEAIAAGNLAARKI